MAVVGAAVEVVISAEVAADVEECKDETAVATASDRLNMQFSAGENSASITSGRD